MRCAKATVGLTAPLLLRIMRERVRERAREATLGLQLQ
jgi:hypothetical protein